jgi:hypothetical protein
MVDTNTNGPLFQSNIPNRCSSLTADEQLVINHPEAPRSRFDLLLILYRDNVYSQGTHIQTLNRLKAA